jgi:Trypsin-like peptidase domain/Concanavalin A-like lectin/glucanases superfamily
MRIHNWIIRRSLAIVLMGFIGLAGGRLERARSAGPPLPNPEITAATLEGPQDDPSKKDDADTQAKARSMELSTEVVRRCKAATALVELRSFGSGSTVCVSADGFFVTNHHVVAGAGLGEIVRVVVYPGQKNQRVLEARVIKLDEDDDLALLKAEAAPDLVTVPLGTDDELVETMPLAAFGYPFGRMLAADKGFPTVSVNTGTITALRRKGGELSKLQHDASVNPGNSGGPVVDKKGNLIGIVVSGMLMARVNFAIPVSRVREFLSGPALVLRNPRLTFPERTKPHQFEIDAYAFDPHLLNDLVVELALTDPPNDTRTFSAKRIGNRFVAEGSACSPAEASVKPIMIVQKGRARIQSELPPGELSFGSRKFSWLAIDSLFKDGDEWVMSLLNGEQFAGKPVGLPSVRFGAGRITQLATADRIEMRLEQAPPTEIAYELQARRGPKVFTPIQGRLRIQNTPRGLMPTFEHSIGRTQITQPIVVEAVVPETLMLGVSPNGLVWLPRPGTQPGMENERGHYILINGQPWYIEQEKHRQPNANGEASLLPILFGVPDCQVRLLWARLDGSGPHRAERVSFDVQKSPQMGVTTVTIKNRAQQPTRIALAITFETPRTIRPLMPPRSQPVLESHWPLNDADATRVTDLGPGKHPGRTSVPQIVPGFRGNGLEIDRQAILCPGVLAIDRTDTFSCSAWIKPGRAENLTIFGRMNGGLRGFDLNLIGTIQAHLISSWDGNAIRVNTIERLDSPQWHHVAMTYDGSGLSRGLKIYLDGALATLEVTVDRLSETIRCDYPFAIGGRERRDYYQGRIDELRAYNRVLTADEIFEMYDLERSDLDPAVGSTLNQGLVGYWSFKGLPAESLRDKSGHGHDGTPELDLGLPEIVDSDGGQAVRLGGSGMVDCGAVADFDRTDSYSLGAWFKPRGDGSRTLMGTMDQVNRGFDLMFNSNVICHLVSEWEGSAIKITTRSTFPNDTWHHVICTYDGSSRSSGFKIYVDGVEAAFDASHDSLTTSPKCHGYFRIGSRVARDYFHGDIDDVFVYRRALSAEEARAWFTRGRIPSQTLSADGKRGLIGLWTFEGNGEEAFRDRSGNGHHGQPDLHSGHSAIVPQGPTRVARFRGIGGINCGPAGDFERTEAFSAGGWFCWEGGPMQTLISKIQYGAPNRGYDIEYDGEKYIAQITNTWDDGPGNSLAIQTAPIRGTGWRHVLFTYDGSSRAPGLKLYVNGELQKVTVLKDNLSKSIRVEEPFVIGSRLVASTMRGRAAHVRLIPRELTPTEVRQLGEADRPPGPLP